MQLEQEIKELIDSRLKAVEDALAKPVTAAATKDAAAGKVEKDELFLARVALLRVAHALGYHPQEYWTKHLRSPYEFRHDFLSGPVSLTGFAQTTLDPELGGALVAPDFSQLRITEFLRAQSVVRRNVTDVIQTDGVFPMGQITEGTVVRPVGEGAPTPLTGLKVKVIVLTPKKMGGLVPLTSEVISAPKTGVLEMVQRDLIQAMSSGQDYFLLQGSGTQHEPKGLVSWAGSSQAITTPVNIENVRKDLTGAILRLRNANLPLARPVWFIAPRTEHFLKNQNNGVIWPWRDEMNSSKTIEGIPYEVTTQIPTNLGAGNDESFIILADMSYSLILDPGMVDVAVSREASFSDGSQIFSSFQNDLVLVRILSKVELGIRHSQAVTLITGVTWGA